MLPIPERSGTNIRIMNLIRGLSSKGEDVDLITFNDKSKVQDDFIELKKHCRNVCLVPWEKNPKLLQLWPILQRFLQWEPFILKYYEKEGFKKQLGKIASENNYNIIVIEHSVMAKYFYCLHQNHGAKTVLVMHDIAFSLYQLRYRYERNIFEKMKLLLSMLPFKKWESKMASLFDMVITVSEHDKKLLLSRMHKVDVRVVANGVNTKINQPFSREARRENILFIGAMDYEPNVDAILYFCNEIFDLIKKSRPNCNLIIVGRSPTEKIIRLGNRPGIIIAGEVKEVKPFYEKSLVAIVPLRSGGGTRLKILEAMALGTPVVSTSIGCEGLEVKNGENILVADIPSDFSQMVISLITDVALWKCISLKARALVEETYDWEKISSGYHDILHELDARS
jgi:glycosyltransferase involved in cell wall biosynthesis